MLETAYAQLRFAASLVFNISFDLPSLNHLVEAMVATHHEFGQLTSEAGELLSGPAMDEEMQSELQQRRFRKQARLGNAETRYYAKLFEEAQINPKTLTVDGIRQLPLTTKQALHTQPDAFLRQRARPTLRTLTTGTTGAPTSMYFSAREMEIFSALAAISNLLRRTVMPDDIIQVSTSARATLANTAFIGACQRTGALVYQTGIIDPAQTLALLSESHNVPSKKARASVLLIYPSYLGKLVTYGLAHGFTPADFGLERILIGGELVTRGLKRRCQALFGDVAFSEAYGITETYPFGGTVCEEGHLHFDPWNGLMEVVNVESGAATPPGETGTLVLTPFMPFRESMVILRYDSQDLVETLTGSCTCSLHKLPAAGQLLGKRRYALSHAQGLTTPRHVLEAIEDVDGVPLPARCGFYLHDGSLTIEVAVAQVSPWLRTQIEQSLRAHRVTFGVLNLVTDPAQLLHPLPLRGDLTEALFDASAAALPARSAAPKPEYNVADSLAA